VAVTEIMQVDEDVKSLINTGASVADIRQKCVSKGMRLLTHSAWRGVMAGVTSIEEMLALSVHHE
jgi:type II secretory ATPase GspE/PulE/Tfp pilus assembly ATPase PilB-like protein